MSGIEEALWVLADGTVFEGEAIGARRDDGRGVDQRPAGQRLGEPGHVGHVAGKQAHGVERPLRAG